jgi:hypothetical protein
VNDLTNLFASFETLLAYSMSDIEAYTTAMANQWFVVAVFQELSKKISE